MIVVEEYVDDETELDEIVGALESVLLNKTWIKENPKKVRKLVLILED